MHLSADSKLSKNVVFVTDRNLPQIVLSHCEEDSSHDVQEDKSLPMQLVCTHNLCAENNTSTVSFLENVKSGDNNMLDSSLVSHSHFSKISKSNKGRPKKSLSCLPSNDNVKQPPRKKSKLSSGLKKTMKLSGELDVEFSAQSLATEIGYEKPHEKITVKSSGIDKEDEITKHISPVEIIQQLIDYRKSCKCFCLTDLNIRDISSHRMEVTLLDRQSRDFFIMGLLRCGAVTAKETYRHNDHIRNRFSYRLMNTRICHCCFLAVNNIGGKYLKNLKKHFAEHGVTSRLHGNLGRKPYHAINSSEMTDVVEFVNRYAASHGVPASKRPKNAKAKHIIRLPRSDNVTSVHKKYKDFSEQSGKRVIALTSFRKIWNHHLPHIKLAVKDPVSPVKNLLNSIDSIEPVPSVDSNVEHSPLKQMLKTEMDSQVINVVTQLQTATTQKIPVNLPYGNNNGEMTHNHMMSLNMYLHDGGNHDALQYDYIFSQNYVPGTHHLQTITSIGPTPLSVHTSSKTCASQTSPSSAQHTSFPVTTSSSVNHTAVTDTFNSSTDKHLLLLSPNSALNANSNPLHVSQFGHKTVVPVFTHTSLTTNAEPSDVHHQQTSSQIGSSLANLSQQIHMSLLQ